VDINHRRRKEENHKTTKDKNHKKWDEIETITKKKT
jgi:hypothetical protein